VIELASVKGRLCCPPQVFVEQSVNVTL